MVGRALRACRSLLLLAAIPFLLAGGRRTIRVFGEPFPIHVCIVVDKSGSMGYGPKPWPYAHAIAEAMRVAMQADDDGQVRFYVFSDNVAAEPQGWIKLPDAEKLAAAEGWLRSFDPSGGTNIPLAFSRAAIVDNKDVRDLGVVIVTDLDPDNSGGEPGAQAAQLAKINATRVLPAQIGILAINPSDGAHDRFGVVSATKSNGYYIRIDDQSQPKPQ